MPLFKFKDSSKCALGVEFSSTRALLAMLLHHTPLAEKFMDSYP
jgi:hypothetical protein